MEALPRIFADPILPRIWLIAFRYSQPVLITMAIRHIGSPAVTGISSYYLILASVVVYLGLAVRIPRQMGRIQPLG